MGKSRVLVVDGVFIGAVVSTPEESGWRIVAAHERIRALDGRMTASVQEAERLARQTYLSTRAEAAAA